jgi:4,5-DOPA dioxygenase extradiol
MTYKSDNQLSHILFIPHGGGPLPLLGDKGHRHLVKFLQEIPSDLGRPSAILVISAHWEENIATNQRRKPFADLRLLRFS